MVLALLQANADTLVKNEEGNTAADVVQNKEIMGMLQKAMLAQRLDAERKLLVAARDGDSGVVSALLTGSNPPAIDCRDANGNTPLHCAANRGHAETVVLLLQNGADATIANNSRRTARDVAKDDRTREMLAVNPVTRSSQAALFSRIEGFLSRSTAFRSKRRYFVLEGGVLSYYDTQTEGSTDARPAGYVYLKNAVISARQGDKTRFIVREGPTTYALQAQTEQDARRWMDALVSQKAQATTLQQSGRTSLNNVLSGAPQPDASRGSIEENLTRADELRMKLASQVSEAKDELEGRGVTAHQARPHSAGAGAGAGGAVAGAASSSSSSSTAAAVVKKLESAMDTANQMNTALSNCLDIVQQMEGYWSKQFEREKESKRVLEECLRVLAAEHHDLERRAHALAVVAGIGGGASGMGGGAVAMDAADNDEFYDAIDGDRFYDAPEDTNEDDISDGGDAGSASAVSVASAVAAVDAAPPSSSSPLGSAVAPAGSFAPPSNRKHSRTHSQSSIAAVAARVQRGSSGGVDIPAIRAVLGPNDRYRTTLPSPTIDRSKVSVWSFLKQFIGKDLSKITMPVLFNEPLSFLQRLCEDLEYSYILDEAAKADDPHTRIAHVAAFASSYFAASEGRVGKPFNPLLGETYELVREEYGFRALAEQVSHHPPISALHADSPNYSFWECNQVRIKFWGKGVEVNPVGTLHLILKGRNEHYTWTKNTTCVHNIIVGKIWLDHTANLRSGTTPPATLRGWISSSGDGSERVPTKSRGTSLTSPDNRAWALTASGTNTQRRTLSPPKR
eukprot:Opistho-2@71204